MLTILCILLGFFVIDIRKGIVYTRAARLSPAEPYAIENYNFELKVVDVQPPIKFCEIQFNHIEVDTTTWPNVKIVENKSLGECGIRLSSPLYKGPWTFYVQDGYGTARKFTATLKIERPPPEPVSKHIRKPVGYSVVEACYSDNFLINYVKIYNPNNELVQEGSSNKLTINPLKPEHNGTWKCVLQLKGRLTEAHNSIYIEVLPNESNDVLKTETKTRINLLYRSPSSSPISTCICERPDGVGFSLIEGIHVERYSYYGLGFGKGHCGITIEKPLQDHEYGMWKCFAPEAKIGGFVRIDKSPTGRTPKDIQTGTTTSSIKILEGGSIEISCHARESLAYCYAKSPGGKIYWSTSTGLAIGQCKVETRIKVGQSDNGTWICGMGVQGYNAGYEDLLVPINVYVYESPVIISKEPQTLVNVGESTEIACRTSLGVGVRYCLFIRPDGTNINIGSIPGNPYGKSSYTYVGEGLEKGDCGLQINPVTEKDIGSWKCLPGIASVSIKPPEYGTTIKVSNVISGK